MKEVFVIVDAYSSGRLFPDLFKEKYPAAELIHVQSTPTVMSKMAVFETHKYKENIIFNNNLDQILDKLSKYKVVAVLAGQEPGVELADLLSERLGLASSNGTQMSAARRDKYAMIKAVADAGLAAPKFIKSKELSEILDWVQNNTTYPVVLKVLRSASTDGVFICAHQQELERAFKECINHRTIMEEINTEVLVESFLKGSEYVVDAVSYAGEHYVTDVWIYQKKYIPGHGNIYDKEMLLAVDLPEVQELIKYNAKMLDALKIDYGPSHAEIMLTPDQGPVLVEVGARINGVVHPKLHNECLGHNQVQLTVDCYANREAFQRGVSQLPYTLKKHAMIVNLINESCGKIESIDNTVYESMKALPSVVDIIIKVTPGQMLSPTRTLIDSPLRFFMAHESETQLQQDYHAIQTLKGRLFRLIPSSTLVGECFGVMAAQKQADSNEKIETPKHNFGACTI